MLNIKKIKAAIMRSLDFTLWSFGLGASNLMPSRIKAASRQRLHDRHKRLYPIGGFPISLCMGHEEGLAYRIMNTSLLAADVPSRDTHLTVNPQAGLCHNMAYVLFNSLVHELSFTIKNQIERDFILKNIAITHFGRRDFFTKPLKHIFVAVNLAEIGQPSIKDIAISYLGKPNAPLRSPPYGRELLAVDPWLASQVKTKEYSIYNLKQIKEIWNKPEMIQARRVVGSEDNWMMFSGVKHILDGYYYAMLFPKTPSYQILLEKYNQMVEEYQATSLEGKLPPEKTVFDVKEDEYRKESPPCPG